MMSAGGSPTIVAAGRHKSDKKPTQQVRQGMGAEGGGSAEVKRHSADAAGSMPTCGQAQLGTHLRRQCLTEGPAVE